MTNEMIDTVQKNESIQTNIPTGDSFVDNGGLVLETIRERFPEKSESCYRCKHLTQKQ